MGDSEAPPSESQDADLILVRALEDYDLPPPKKTGGADPAATAAAKHRR